MAAMSRAAHLKGQANESETSVCFVLVVSSEGSWSGRCRYLTCSCQLLLFHPHLHRTNDTRRVDPRVMRFRRDLAQTSLRNKNDAPCIFLPHLASLIYIPTIYIPTILHGLRAPEGCILEGQPGAGDKKTSGLPHFSKLDSPFRVTQPHSNAVE
jgi:hypothetical protein